MSVKQMNLGIYKESCVKEFEFPLLWIPQNVKVFEQEKGPIVW